MSGFHVSHTLVPADNKAVHGDVDAGLQVQEPDCCKRNPDINRGVRIAEALGPHGAGQHNDLPIAEAADALVDIGCRLEHGIGPVRDDDTVARLTSQHTFDTLSVVVSDLLAVFPEYLRYPPREGQAEPLHNSGHGRVADLKVPPFRYLGVVLIDSPSRGEEYHFIHCRMSPVVNTLPQGREADKVSTLYQEMALAARI